MPHFGMANRQRAVHQLAMPLMARINKGEFTKAGVAKKLEVRPQDVTNWLARGIPYRKLPEVADLCGLSTDEYRHEAGVAKTPPKPSKRSVASHIENFDALPEFLQAYVAKRIARVRANWESAPAWLRERLVPPKDPEAYREWERTIEDLMDRLPQGKG